MRRLTGVVGELLVTAAVLIGLFVVWQVWFVGIVEGRAQQDAAVRLERDLAAGPGPAGHGGGHAPGSVRPAPGDPVGVLRVPRLGGPTWARPVYEGVGLDVLARGIGRYPSGAAPGAVGNFALAGHRSGHGNPLIDIDRLRAGDVVVVEVAAGSYVYRVDRHVVTGPHDTSVLAPTPQRPGVDPTARSLTLTTCSPRYGSSSRYVVFGHLERFLARPARVPAALLADPDLADRPSEGG